MTTLDALIYRRRLYYLRRRLRSARPLAPWEKAEIADELEKLIHQNRLVFPAARRLNSRNTLQEEPS